MASIVELYKMSVKQYCERVDELATAQIAELKAKDTYELAYADAYLRTPDTCKNKETRDAWVLKETWKEHTAVTDATARRIRAWAEMERAKVRLDYMKRMMNMQIGEEE